MMLEKEMFSIDDGRYRVTARLSMLPADCSMRVAQPQRRHGLRWSPDGSAEQAVLMCRRNAGSDGHRFRLADADCQRGTTAPHRVVYCIKRLVTCHMSVKQIKNNSSTKSQTTMHEHT